jgi:UDP-N-acetylglucosamine/UDP-N-acetylgalactosamine diphosphorylase
MAHAEKTGVLVYPREDVYAPLKNLEGRHSLETVKLALSAFDKRLVADLTKMPEPGHLFELDPAFYYVALDRKKLWNGKTLPLLDYYPASELI